MRYILLFLVASFFLNKSVAQHCPFDFSRIMVVKVTSEEDTLLVPNLKITLLDSLNNTITLPGNLYWADWADWDSDTLQLWQNPPITTHSDRRNLHHWRIHFPFAQDNYVLVAWKLPGTQLKIEDIDGDKNGGYFQTVVIPVDSDHLYPLCSSLSRWQDGWLNGEDHGFVEDYQPIEVKLHKK